MDDIDYTVGLNGRLGIEILERSPDKVVGTMPVEGNTQPRGMLHGGASLALAETLGSIGASLHADQFDRFSVGIDINGTHHRVATEGVVVGVATPLHQGRSIATYEVVIRDSEERRVCTARITCSLIPRPK